MSIRRILPLALLSPFAVTLFGCVGFSVDGNGKPVDDTRSLAGFVKVESDTTLDVAIRQGRENRVDIHVDANLLHLITTRVEGGALVIDAKEDINPRVPGPHVVVTMPKLERAEMGGSGRMTIPSFESDTPVRLVLSGSGDLDFDGKAPEVDAFLSGSGDVGLTGAVDRVDLDLSGSGKIEARALSASRARAALSGSGDIIANVVGPVDVSLSGSGDIEIFGKPEIDHFSKTGSGALKIR